MTGKFVITKTPKGFYRFSLQSSNSQTVLTSQNYASLNNCKNGIEAIKKNALAEIEDQTLQKPVEKKNPKFEVYLDNAGMYRYRMLASNGQNIAVSEDGYASKSGCLNGISAISRAAEDAVIDDSAVK
ncbi:MAG: DUF1508 domain-containing protein [Spirochaetia bacterium]|nr:DUF1508 domain-containing protein [Spirochaetia bacterium]